MKSYQLKIILKKSKPPVWRRCVIPSGITFSQLALILEEITETEISSDYEYEFYHAGIQIREWTEAERHVTSYYYDYMCAPDTYVDTLTVTEEWFTFRPGNGEEYRVEIEKRLPDRIPWPSVLKQKGSRPVREWSDTEAVNGKLRKRYPVSYGEPDYRTFAELAEEQSAGRCGIKGAEKPTDRTERNEKSGNSMMKDFAEKLTRAFSDKVTEKILEETKESGNPADISVDRLRDILEENVWQMKKEARGQIFGMSGEEESRKPDLREFLFSADREDLLEMAGDLGLSHFTSLNKSQLAERIRDEILKPEVMAKRMLLLSDDEIREFEKAAAKENGFYPERDEMRKLEKLYDLAYIVIYHDDYAEVPREVVRVYEKINTPEYQEKRKGTFWMYHCLMAVEMLYGTAPERIARRMLRKCLGHKVTPEEFKTFFFNVPEDLNLCVLRNGRVIDKELLRDDMFLKLEEIQEGKDFYIPGPEEILDYTENGYPTSDLYYCRLKTFLVKVLEVGLEEAEEFLALIWRQLSVGNDFPDVMEMFREENIVFPDEDALKEFAELIPDVNNHTRMTIHRGHTPIEMMRSMPAMPKGKRPVIVPMSSGAAELLGSAADEIGGMGFDLDLDYNADEITTMAMPSGVSGEMVTGKKKIYPNDPCPCGSGKKYKKCCGKK